jgi:S-(hydroxymethyl)glutathione dehydrogenase/alcohol dehydrogenase
MCLLGTFAHHTVVNEASCIKIEQDVPLDRACLLGCGVVTGWGSAVYAAEVTPGDVVAVVGVGGIGANAIQGAKLAGAKQIWAIDPVEFKREKAMEFGATHTAASMQEALPLIQEASWGTMANKVIMTMGVGQGSVLGEALALTAKRGRVVVTNIHPAMEMSANVSLLDMTLMEKQVVGSLFGSGNPRADIPKLLNLYREGQLDLDGLVTTTYTLDQVNDGYDAMREGTNIRGVMVYEH